MSINDQIMLDAIQVDTHYMGRVINSFKDVDEELQVGAIFSIYPYFSLFIHESRAQLKNISPTDYAKASLTVDASEMVAKSRHSLKLFEDNKRGILGQLEYYESISTVHKHYFIDSVRLPWADRWKSDLSVVYYDDKIISTSHSTTFALGLDLQDLFKDSMGANLISINTELGEYLSAWGITRSKAISFANSMARAKYKPKDVRSASYYPNTFNGKETPGYNALLTTFQALINSCNDIISLDTSFESAQTIFKIKFLTIYQVLRSLDMQAEKLILLTNRSLEHIDKLLTQPTAKMILETTKKPFRNTLMHYNVDSRIDASYLDINKPLYGLSEAVYRIAYDELEKKISELISESAKIINQWAEVG